VPGDAVDVWTRPAGGRVWSKAASLTAAASTAWSVRLRFRQDTTWRATSASGTSPTFTTVVVPTIHAPARTTRGALVHLYGSAPPGRTLTLYRQVVGSTAWAALRRLPVTSAGGWSTWRRPTRSLRFRVVSGARPSRVVTVVVR
jgi:hypothetical protein